MTQQIFHCNTPVVDDMCIVCHRYIFVRLGTSILDKYAIKHAPYEMYRLLKYV